MTFKEEDMLNMVVTFDGDFFSDEGYKIKEIEEFVKEKKFKGKGKIIDLRERFKKRKKREDLEL